MRGLAVHAAMPLRNSLPLKYSLEARLAFLHLRVCQLPQD